MNLSKVERWLLSNQLRILEALYPEEAPDFAKARLILERGYEIHYDWAAASVCRDVGVSQAECLEVTDILEMFCHLRASYEALDDHSGLSEKALRMDGFDANNEWGQMKYARDLCRIDGRFAHLDPNAVYDSHMPRMASYRRMLSAWKENASECLLSKEGLLRIQKVRSMQ